MRRGGEAIRPPNAPRGHASREAADARGRGVTTVGDAAGAGLAMDRVLNAERRLRRMACPGCASAGSLQTAIRCELAHGECRFTVRCQRCGIIVELSTETESPRLFQPDLHAWLSARVCPICKGGGAEVVFRCDVPTRPGFYRVKCRTCGHEYAAERAAAPADPGEASP